MSGCVGWQSAAEAAGLLVASNDSSAAGEAAEAEVSSSAVISSATGCSESSLLQPAKKSTRRTGDRYPVTDAALTSLLLSFALDCCSVLIREPPYFALSPR